jgi:hypothetical protein
MFAGRYESRGLSLATAVESLLYRRISKISEDLPVKWWLFATSTELKKVVGEQYQHIEPEIMANCGAQFY